MNKDSKKADSVSGPLHIFVSEGLLIAASPVIAYAWVFAYEAAFCRAFRIPPSFITMNLTTVLIAFGTLVAVLMALFMLANLAVMIGIDIRSPIGRSLLRLSIPTLLVMTEFLLYGNVWRPWVSAAGVLVIFVLLEFGLPLLTQRDKKTYREKLLAQEAHEDKIDSLPTRLARLLGIPSYWLLLGVFLGVWLFHVAGDAQARRQKEFLVIASTPECVVLRIYGDELICAPFNRATKEVLPSFSIIKYANSASEPRLQLGLEKVGPLKLADLGD